MTSGGDGREALRTWIASVVEAEALCYPEIAWDIAGAVLAALPAPSGDGREALLATVRCPAHGIPDCSPLLNGCNLPGVIRAALVAQFPAPAPEAAAPQAASDLERGPDAASPVAAAPQDEDCDEAAWPHSDRANAPCPCITGELHGLRARRAAAEGALAKVRALLDDPKRTWAIGGQSTVMVRLDDLRAALGPEATP